MLGVRRFAAAARSFLDDERAQSRRRSQLSIGVSGARMDPERTALAETYRKTILEAVTRAWSAAEDELKRG